jgi:hypothetical protein
MADGSRSRWGALAEQGEAGSGHGRFPPALPVQIGRYCPCVGKLNSKQAQVARIQVLRALVDLPGRTSPRWANVPRWGEKQRRCSMACGYLLPPTTPP